MMEELLKSLTDGGITTFTVIFLLVSILYRYLSTPKGIPPGPIGLPLVGYQPFLGKTPSKVITKLGRKYGSVFSFYIGSRLAVVLNDYEAINEAFVKNGELFTGRPNEMQNVFPIENPENIAASEGEFWRDHRRFAMVLLRDCGVGKLSIEPRMTEEINYFLDELRKTNGKANDIRDMLSVSISNNICIMALGKRFDYEDNTFLKIKHSVDEIIQSISTTSVLTFYPWFKYVPGIRRILKYDKLHNLLVDIDDFLEQIRSEHQKSHYDGQRDHYVSAYLTEQNERFQKYNKHDDIFTDRALINNMRALLGAGTETTTNTLLWGLVYMMRHPDIQEKVQKEIDAVIGSERSPSWNDRLRTPYTEATICEIQRKANLVPLNIPHRNIEECEIFGYKIPADTFILSNLGHVLSDPTLWDDPNNFRPERFLNDKGEVDRPPYFIPFSTGKRQCLGETLAKMELYLYFTSMLQKFTFKSPDGKMPGLESMVGFTNIPINSVTCAISRNK